MVFQAPELRYRLEEQSRIHFYGTNLRQRQCRNLWSVMSSVLLAGGDVQLNL